MKQNPNWYVWNGPRLSNLLRILNSIMIHCQGCTTRNALTRQFCWKCGTRLLVTAGSEPSTSPMSFMDEHVLERISAMEYALSIMNKRVDSLTQTMERVAANNFVDHAMIETLTDTVESIGISRATLEAEWRKRIDSRLTENDEVDRLGARMDRIIDLYRGSRRKQFTMWMERAYELLVSDRSVESLASLRSAFEQDPSNHELGMLIAEVFFQTQDLAAASRCLAQVLETKPEHFEATLLMGLVQQSHGNVSEAQKLLETAVRLREDSPSAHATLGSLFIDSGNYEKARAHLSRALELKPTAPAHFMLGAAYYQDGHQRRAITHLKQATQLDPEFGEAFYQLGLLCLEMNWIHKARECFEHAQRLRPQESRYRQKVRGFSEGRVTPEQLTGLVREELHLTTCWDFKGSN